MSIDNIVLNFHSRSRRLLIAAQEESGIELQFASFSIGNLISNEVLICETPEGSYFLSC